MFPIGFRTCSFHGLAVVSVLVVYFFFIFPFLSSIIVGNIIRAPHFYVQICAAASVEDHCLVLSFGRLAVWLSSLLALSLRCRGHLTQLFSSEPWRTCCMAQFLAFAVLAVSWTPDICLVLSFGGLTVWLSSLLVLSLQ